MFRISQIEHVFLKIGIRLGQLHFYNQRDSYYDAMPAAEASLITADLHETFQQLDKLLPLKKTSLRKVLGPRGEALVSGLYHFDGGLYRTNAMRENIGRALQSLVQDEETRTRCSDFFEIGHQIGWQWPGFWDPWDPPTRKVGMTQNPSSGCWSASVRGLTTSSPSRSRRKSEMLACRCPLWRRPLKIAADAVVTASDWDPVEFGLARLERQIRDSSSDSISLPIAEDVTGRSPLPESRRDTEEPRQAIQIDIDASNNFIISFNIRQVCITDSSHKFIIARLALNIIEGMASGIVAWSALHTELDPEADPNKASEKVRKIKHRLEGLIRKGLGPPPSGEIWLPTARGHGFSLNLSVDWKASNRLVRLLAPSTPPTRSFEPGIMGQTVPRAVDKLPAASNRGRNPRAKD